MWVGKRAMQDAESLSKNAWSAAHLDVACRYTDRYMQRYTDRYTVTSTSRAARLSCSVAFFASGRAHATKAARDSSATMR